MVELVTKYPFLLYLLIAASCVVLPVLIVIAIMAFLQGREVDTPILRIGAKPTVESATPSAIPPVTPGTLTQDQMDEVVSRVSASLRAEAAKSNAESGPKELQPAKVPDHTLGLFAAKLAIQRKIRDIVVSTGGGWAGVSLASLERFQELADQFSMIDKEVLQQVNDFLWLTIPGIYGDSISDEQYQETMQLANIIMKKIEGMPRGMFG